MRVSTFFYLFKQGLINIWRNKLFSLASIATMTACIFLFGVFYSIGVNVEKMTQEAQESVSITVYFNYGITQDQIDDIGWQIQQRPEVKEYRFISAEEAWESYKAQMFEGREELAAGFSENPLANSASYEIFLNDISKQQELSEFLEQVNGVRQVNRSEAAASTLEDFKNIVTLVFISIIIILIAVAVFLIGNTITVGITVRSEEIAIMKLIGAKDGFVRAPFIIEGIFIGAVGSVLPLIILYFIYGGITSYLTGRFDALSSLFEVVPIADVFMILVPVSIVLGIGIGFIGSRVTVRRHLKV